MTGVGENMYRQCPDCASLDFTYKVGAIEKCVTLVKFRCASEESECSFEWVEKIYCSNWYGKKKNFRLLVKLYKGGDFESE